MTINTFSKPTQSEDIVNNSLFDGVYTIYRRQDGRGGGKKNKIKAHIRMENKIYESIIISQAWEA